MVGRSFGQSLAEYGLLIALVALVSVGVLGILAVQLDSTAATSGDGISGGIGFGGISGSGSTMGNGGGTHRLGRNVITLSNGTTVALDDFTHMSEVIETSGANGTTTLLMSNLASIVSQLEDNGTLTSAQAAILQDLANQGHKIAEIEKLIEEAAASSTSPLALYNSPITYNGQTYASHELMLHVGWDPQQTDQSVPFEQLYVSPNEGHETKVFQELYQEALASGALDDPVVYELIQAMGKDVALMACNMGGYYYLLESNALRGDNSLDPDVTLKEGLISSATNLQSVGICNTGGGQDTGVQCQ